MSPQGHFSSKILQNIVLSKSLKWRSPRQDVALQGVKRIHTNALCVHYCLDGSLQARSCLINSIHHPRDSGEGAQSQEGSGWSPEPKSTAKERSERKDILAHPLVSFHALWHLGRNKSFTEKRLAWQRTAPSLLASLCS